MRKSSKLFAILRLTFRFTRRFDAAYSKAYSTSTQNSRRQNVVEAARGGAQNKRPACAPSTIFVAQTRAPATSLRVSVFGGATAPQGAQQIKFVV
ncbi:MAG: hypothetical protein LDLANPLL_00441 [Turneriella sp.]|nr:hypothetical protein [Turneriella sp.]